jgi:hypothetical protein
VARNINKDTDSSVNTYHRITEEPFDSDILGPRGSYKGPNSFAGVEARSNTSTVALQVVGGDEKGSLEYEGVK